jgi:hypothetical protein
MSDTLIFGAGVVVFLMLGGGIIFTLLEVRRIDEAGASNKLKGREVRTASANKN